MLLTLLVCLGIRPSLPIKLPNAEAPCPPSWSDVLKRPLIDLDKLFSPAASPALRGESPIERLTFLVLDSLSIALVTLVRLVTACESPLVDSPRSMDLFSKLERSMFDNFVRLLMIGFHLVPLRFLMLLTKLLTPAE